MKSGKLQKFNAETIAISDNVTRHNESRIAMKLQWMNEAVYRGRSKSDTIFNYLAEDNTAPRVLFSHFFTRVVSCYNIHNK